jgi:hypothetical protein
MTSQKRFVSPARHGQRETEKEEKKPITQHNTPERTRHTIEVPLARHAPPTLFQDAQRMRAQRRSELDASMNGTRPRLPPTDSLLRFILLGVSGLGK